MPLRHEELHARLAPFREAGLLSRIPTPMQIWQGEMEMLPYVISSDATEEPRYAGAPLGHPVVRQPFILAQIGRDHLDVGTGLAAKPISVVRHLHFTYHQGMPVWDLQVLQASPGGLELLERETHAMLNPRTLEQQARRALLGAIIPQPESYLRAFLGEDGFIARAARFDYPEPDETGAALPPEFFSLVHFLEHCAMNHPTEVPLIERPARALSLVRRRFREGKGLGWPEMPIIGRAA